MEKNGGICKLQNAEQKWSGMVEKRDRIIHTEEEGKESISIVWGRGVGVVPKSAEGRLPPDKCSGSEAGSGSTCFWASRIRIH